MMKYIKHNPENFKNGTVVHAFSIALMKLVGGYITEIMNINLICSSTTIEDVVKDFISLGIIAEIDNLMAFTVNQYNISEELEHAHI